MQLWGGENGEDGQRGTRFDRVPLHETWAEMEALVDEGLVKQIGVSNFNVQLLMDLMTYARIRPVCNQVELHPYLPQNDLMACMRYFGLTPVAYSPLGSSVEWQKGKPNIREDPVVVRIAQERGETPSQVLIRWHVQRGHVVIPKAVNPVHIEENFRAAFENEVLSEVQMRDLNGLDKGPNGRYLHGDVAWSGFA